MNENRLPWARLDRAYYADDVLVMARQEFGLLAEVLWTRWLAHGEPIKAPEESEGTVIAGCLGFPDDDAPMIGLIVEALAETGAVQVARKRGPARKTSPRILSWDLANRQKYRPADRFLTPKDRRSQGTQDRDRSRDRSRDGTSDNERTNRRTRRTNARTHAEGEQLTAVPSTQEQPRAEGEEHEGRPLGETEIDRLAAELGWNRGRVLKFAYVDLGMKQITSGDWSKLLDSDAEKLAAAMREAM